MADKKTQPKKAGNKKPQEDKPLTGKEIIEKTHKIRPPKTKTLQREIKEAMGNDQDLEVPDIKIDEDPIPEDNMEPTTPKKKAGRPKKGSKPEGNGSPDGVAGEGTGEVRKETGKRPYVKRNEKVPAGGGGWGKIKLEDKLAILTKFEAGVFAKDIAAEYGISQAYVYRILNDPIVMEARVQHKEATIKSTLQMLQENNKTIENITKTYLDLAIDPARIARTNLVGLFTVWGIIVDKQMKMQEMELRAEEYRLRRAELEKGRSENGSLLSEFIEVIKSKDNLPKDD